MEGEEEAILSALHVFDHIYIAYIYIYVMFTSLPVCSDAFSASIFASFASLQKY
jgi:hypothetical protein